MVKMLKQYQLESLTKLKELEERSQEVENLRVQREAAFKLSIKECNEVSQNYARLANIQKEVQPWLKLYQWMVDTGHTIQLKVPVRTKPSKDVWEAYKDCAWDWEITGIVEDVCGSMNESLTESVLDKSVWVLIKIKDGLVARYTPKHSTKKPDHYINYSRYLDPFQCQDFGGRTYKAMFHQASEDTNLSDTVKTNNEKEAQHWLKSHGTQKKWNEWVDLVEELPRWVHEEGMKTAWSPDILLDQIRSHIQGEYKDEVLMELERWMLCDMNSKARKVQSSRPSKRL